MDNKNLWAPWRMEYIRGLNEDTECFLCDYINDPDGDVSNHLLWRTEHSVVVFNRFPYNNGHLLISPKRHVGDLEDMNEKELLEMTKLVRECKKALSGTIFPHGYNVGINIGRCAGAGLPGHIHAHIVPRWNGDTNFMAVTGQTDVVSQSLDDLYEILCKYSRDNGLPEL